MEEIIKRIVKRLFPEITGGLHLPQWGRVATDPTAIEAAKTSTALKPLYAVDIQLLQGDGSADEEVPILRDVPLPASFAGNHRGLYGFPPRGTLVELGFIQGLPSKPFVRTVLIENIVVPELGENDVLIQQSETVFQRADSQGNWLRECPEEISDTAKNYTEQIEEIKRSLAGVNHHIEVAGGGTVWIGDENHNALNLLSQLMGIVEQLGNDLATHTHKDVQSGAAVSGPPQNISPFTGAAGSSAGIKGQLDSFVE